MTSLWLDTCTPHPRTATLPVGGHVDVLVAGAGITGLATAALLARAGKDVLVVEGRHVGAVATGNTTAKVSLLQGSVLSQIRSHHSARMVKAYVDGNREAREWLARFMEERAVPFERRDAWTYATTRQGERTLADELRAATEAGLPAVATTETELPFAARAIRLADQVQIHPGLVLQALLDDLEEHGGRVVEGVRLTGVRAGSPSTVETTAGDVRADDVVLATGSPVLDRGLYFAKLEAHRSYAAALDVRGTVTPVPQGMYLSVDKDSRSLRTADTDLGEQLLVGGAGHVVGREASEQAQVDRLLGWAQEHWPGAQVTHRWSAQDYQAAGRVPFVGVMPRTGGHVHVATGYNKWGMTGGVMAALTLSSDILGGGIGDWARTMRHRITTPRDLVAGLRANLGVGVEMARGWASVVTGDAYGSRTKGADAPPDTGVSRVCPHLGGIVEWNDAEGSWDCPLHGSRFDRDGRVLEGPATRGLPTDD